MCIFFTLNKKKFRNKIKVHKVHKIHHYNEIDVKVNLKHNQVQCVFPFLFLYSKGKKIERKTFFYKICHIIKINAAK